MYWKALSGGLFLILLLAYVVAYLFFRGTNTEIRHGHTYLLFPEDRPYLREVFRPAVYIDQRISDVQVGTERR
jgi:hypothetical protein